MTSYRLYPSVTGPATGSADTVQYVFGLSFTVTSPSLFLEGWWWWVAASSQSTAAEDFALWQTTGTGTGTYITGSKVTSGTFTAGQWNFIACNSPIPLTSGQEYRAVKTVNKAGDASNHYSTSGHYFDTTGAGASGVINGPLLAYAAGGQATNPEPHGEAQMVFINPATDVTASYPITGFQNSNYFLDVQVRDMYLPTLTRSSFRIASAGAVWRLPPRQHGTRVLTTTQAGSAILQAPSVLAVGATAGPDLGALWAAYLAAAFQLADLENYWRMAAPGMRTDGTAGRFYAQLYTAQQAKDNAYTAWDVARRRIVGEAPRTN